MIGLLLLLAIACVTLFFLGISTGVWWMGFVLVGATLLGGFIGTAIAFLVVSLKDALS